MNHFLLILGYILRPFPRNAAEQITFEVVSQLAKILVNLEGNCFELKKL